MASYPVDVRRCQHIRTNGTQCGSPSLRDGKFCYHHQECGPERVTVKALQIASANLKRMEAEKPRPVQVVVDPAKVAETPLGLTPWSGNEKGHEIEEMAVGFQGEMAAKLKREASAVRERYAMHQSAARRLAREMNEYLENEPELNHEELRRNMAIIAVHIEECLVG